MDFWIIFFLGLVFIIAFACLQEELPSVGYDEGCVKTKKGKPKIIEATVHDTF